MGRLLANLDTILGVSFGVLATLSLLGAILCFRKALAAASHKDGELKMFFWATGTLIGLIVSGLSSAYILLPIIMNR